jgi:uncharacterized hydrophobic protein (TIGR00271 family)
MLTLRLSAPPTSAPGLVEALAGTDGVRRMVELPAAGGEDEVVLFADLEPRAADRVLVLIHELGFGTDDYVIARADVVAPTPLGRPGAPQPFAWIELISEARANAGLIGRYCALMTVAAVVASLGVITDNPILIVGAMAVSPDLLPICAACVGVVGRRRRLLWRAVVTLVVGLILVVAVAAALTAAAQASGALESGYEPTEQGLGSLTTTDYTTVLLALAAGVAAILAFETRASAAVGVAISVTTIPASAFAGVAIGAGVGKEVPGALVVLAVNVILLMVSGSLTLAAQHALTRRQRVPIASPL